MSEFILELYSEEIPPNLQVNARKDLQEKIKKSLSNIVSLVGDENTLKKPNFKFSSIKELLIFS